MTARLAVAAARIPASVALFLFFFSIYAFTMSGQIQYGDEVEKYRVAQSIVERGQLSIRPIGIKKDVGVGGLTYSAYELGQTIVEIPFYALGKGLDALFPRPDVNQIAMLLVGFLNPLVTALTCVVLFATCGQMGYRRRTAGALTLVFGLATIAWPFSKGFTREPLLALFLLLSYYAVLRFQASRANRWLLATGMALGLLSFTKFIQAAVIPVFFVYVVVLIAQERNQAGDSRTATLRAVVRGSAIFLLPFIAFLVIQGVYALARFGTPVGGIAGVKTDPISWILSLLPRSEPGTALLSLLFWPNKSIFVYSPPAVLFIFGWIAWLRRDKQPALLLLGIVAVAWVSVLARPDWDGGTWWGPRYLAQITPFLVLPLGMLEFTRPPIRRVWKALLGAAFLAGLAVQLIAAFANWRDYLDIMGAGITLAGQIDFLQHRVVDSLVLYVSPRGVAVNPYGLVLLLAAAVSGGVLLVVLRRDGVRPGSWAGGSMYLAAALMLELLALVFWVIAPYSQVLAAQGDDRFAAASSFLAAGRTCEAQAMFRLAIARETSYLPEALAELDRLAPPPSGTLIGAASLMSEQEKSGPVQLEEDGTVTISGEGSLKAAALAQVDVIARGHAQPVPVQRGSTYLVSGWIKTENVYGSGYASVTVVEDDGAFRHMQDTDIVNSSETHGWVYFAKTIKMLPTTHRLYVAAGLWKTFGAAWVDSLQVTPVTRDSSPAPAPAACR